MFHLHQQEEYSNSMANFVEKNKKGQFVKEKEHQQDSSYGRQIQNQV